MPNLPCGTCGTYESSHQIEVLHSLILLLFVLYPLPEFIFNCFISCKTKSYINLLIYFLEWCGPSVLPNSPFTPIMQWVSKSYLKVNQHRKKSQSKWLLFESSCSRNYGTTVTRIFKMMQMKMFERHHLTLSLEYINLWWLVQR